MTSLLFSCCSNESNYLVGEQKSAHREEKLILIHLMNEQDDRMAFGRPPIIGRAHGMEYYVESERE